MGLVNRRLEEVAVNRMAESSVVLLEGPRSVGKSTLLRNTGRGFRRSRGRSRRSGGALGGR